MRVMYCLIQLWMTAAQADPTTDLAPGPRELGETQAELERRLLEAEAIERAVARLQSAFSGTPASVDTCLDPIRGPYANRIRLFARAWHDAAQRVRVQAARVERIASSPTVAPIVDVDRRALVDSLLDRSEAQESGWLELVAWVNHSLSDVCDLPLLTAPGVPDPIIRGVGEKTGAVALIAISPGYVCPVGAESGLVADDRVMIVTGPTCWSEKPGCNCEPGPVNTGAILGPPLPEPEPVPFVPMGPPSLEELALVEDVPVPEPEPEPEPRRAPKPPPAVPPPAEPPPAEPPPAVPPPAEDPTAPVD